MIPLIIQDQFYTIQNLQRFPIPQTSNWSGISFCCFLQQTGSSKYYVSFELTCSMWFGMICPSLLILCVSNLVMTYCNIFLFCFWFLFFVFFLKVFVVWFSNSSNLFFISRWHKYLQKCLAGLDRFSVIFSKKLTVLQHVEASLF